MFKKILLITALVAIIGVLVFGAIYRTQAKLSDGLSAGNSANGHNDDSAISADQNIDSNQTTTDTGSGHGNGHGGNGGGGGGD